MKNYYFFNLIKKTTIQFLDVFNDIQIAKYNSDGTISKYIDVPIKLSSKQKFYYWVNDRTNEKRLPMMSCNLTEITPAINERGTNNKLKIKFDDDTYHLNLIPYDFTFELMIGAKYLSEMEQILEQILPFFDPYIYTTLTLPEINNSFDVKIILNSISQEKSIEMAEEDYRVLTFNINFTCKGYLLKPTADLNLIHNIYLQMINNIEFIEPSNVLEVDELTNETISISGNKIDDEILYNYEILNNE